MGPSSQLVGRFVCNCSRGEFLVWSYAVLLSPGSSCRTTAESHSHLYSLDDSSQPMTFSSIGTNRTARFTEVRISRTHAWYGLSGCFMLQNVKFTCAATRCHLLRKRTRRQVNRIVRQFLPCPLFSFQSSAMICSMVDTISSTSSGKTSENHTF